MTFILLFILVLLIVLVLRTYKTLSSVIAAIVIMLGTTTAVFIYGCYALSGNPFITFFNSTISRREFYYLLGAWYGVDCFCSFLIIRNHIAYRNINDKGNSNLRFPDHP